MSYSWDIDKCRKRADELIDTICAFIYTHKRTGSYEFRNREATKMFLEFLYVESAELHRCRYTYSEYHHFLTCLLNTKHGVYESWFARRVKEFERAICAQAPKLLQHGGKRRKRTAPQHKPTTLYYLRVQPEGWEPIYKVGITTLSVGKRYKGTFNAGRYVTLHEQVFSSWHEAYREEQRIVREHATHAYTGDHPLQGVGTSEMFTVDVLGYDHAG